jgi:N-acetylglutamate synthase-like GNAT family acetyltransferase
VGTTIRNATAEDVPLLARLIRDSFRDVAERFRLTAQNCPTHASNCTAEWVASAMNGGHRFYVLESDGVPRGCTAVEQTGDEVCRLKRLGVLPEFRRKGVGEALVRHGLAEARRLGAKRVEIGVIADHVELKDWYARLGFGVDREAVSLPHLPFKVTYMTIAVQGIGDTSESKMNAVDRLESWFSCGHLIWPSAEVLNFVDLVRALLRLGGAEAAGPGPGVDALCRQIGPAEHYVFILIDGMGASQLKKLPSNAFLRMHQVGELRAVFLSTTAAALTTLATGLWPCSHGVPGWWTYLDDRDTSIVTLRFQERTTERPLGQLGVRPEEVFTVPSIWPALKYKPLSVLPAEYLGSAYTTYTTGGTACAGYTNLPQAMAIARKGVLNAQQPSFIYLYLPQLDELSHQRGPDDDRVFNLLRLLDVTLTGLAEALNDRARIVIAADHGQGTVPAERRFILPKDDPLREHLLCRPTGEPTVPVFHIHPSHEEQFAAEFTGRFGEHFALLTARQIEDLHLLGPNGLSEITRRRLGTFVGIARRPSRFYIEPTDGHPEYVGVHGGLSPEEMVVPLVVV